MTACGAGESIKPGAQAPGSIIRGCESRLIADSSLMRFLIDRCAGTFIAEWLRTRGHDVVESRERGPDPGDRILLEWAAQESRILITIDTDFGQLVFFSPSLWEGTKGKGLSQVRPSPRPSPKRERETRIQCYLRPNNRGLKK